MAEQHDMVIKMLSLIKFRGFLFSGNFKEYRDGRK
jgi:hypothetical protein